MDATETERKCWPVTCQSRRRGWAPSHPATWRGKERPTPGLRGTTVKCLFISHLTRGPFSSLALYSLFNVPRSLTGPPPLAKPMICPAYGLTGLKFWLEMMLDLKFSNTPSLSPFSLWRNYTKLGNGYWICPVACFLCKIVLPFFFNYFQNLI